MSCRIKESVVLEVRDEHIPVVSMRNLSRLYQQFPRTFRRGTNTVNAQPDFEERRMIASAKKASQMEAVRRNGHPSVREQALPSKANFSDQAEAFKQQADALSQMARLLAVTIERLVATSEVLLLANIDVELGIDFYAEVERYELILIQRALRKAKGSQTKAAALLKLKPTTLNSKIKLYVGRDGTVDFRNTRFSSLS